MLLSGPVFTRVRIKARKSDADAYVIELERRCGQEEVDSAVDRLEGQMQSEACKAVEMMHLDLASLRAKLAKETSQHEKECKGWREDKEHLDSEIAALKAKLASAQVHAQELVADGREQEERHGAEMSQQSDRLAAARSATSTAKAEIDVLVKEKSALMTELERSKAAALQSEAEAAGAKQVAECARKETELAGKAVEEVKAQLAGAAAKLDEAQAQVLKLDTARAAADEKIQRLQNELSNANADKEKLDAEISTLTKESAKKDGQLQETAAVTAHLRAEMEALRTQLTGKDSQIKTLEEELAGAEKLVAEKRKELQKMMEDYHSVEEDLSKSAAQEAVARNKLQEATRVWDTARVSYQEYHDSMRARMAEATKAAQAMYIAVCQPTVGSVAGLGLVLAAPPQGMKNPVIQELVEGGAAKACGKMSAGDLLLAVDGAATQGAGLEDVEVMLCGKVGSKMTIRAQTPGSKKAYEVAVVRELAADEAAVSSLATWLQPEAVRVAAGMHQELEDLRARVKVEALKHKEFERDKRNEAEALQGQLADGLRKLELQSQEAAEALADKDAMEKDLREQIQSLQSRVDASKSAAAKALAQLNEQEKVTMTIKSKLVAAKAAAEDAETSAGSVAKLAEDRAQGLAAAEYAVRRLQGELDAARAKLDTSSVRVMGLEAALADAKASQESLAADCQTKDEEIQQLRSEIEELKRLTDQQEHELEAAQERNVRQREEKNEAAKLAKQEQKRAATREADLDASAEQATMLHESPAPVTEV